jgi:cell division protein FtsA
VVSAETSYLRNFSKVLSQANIEVMDRIFTPLASGDFILTLRQKKAGTVMIDLGYTSTSFIIWENEEVIGSGVVPIGSDHITADLAVGLQTNMEMAEEIKKEHLNLSSQNPTEINEIEMFNPDLQINEIFKISEIAGYARPRVEEMFLYLSKELRRFGKSSLPGGAVLIGGGSALIGIDEIARSVLKIPIFKYNFDRNTVDFVPDYNNDPSFINVVALAAYSIHHQEEMNYNQKYSRGNNNLQNKEEIGGFLGFLRRLLPWS